MSLLSGEKLEAFYGLPNEVKFCTRCVMSNQRPNSVVEYLAKDADKKRTVSFDEEGVCLACRHQDRKNNEIDWKKREEALLRLCDKYRRNDGRYDCICPGSGGKDSGYVSHILKYKYGMNPLTVTWAPHLYTDIGWDNFQAWIHAGFDNYLYTPSGALHRKLTQLAFLNLCHPFQPFIIGQKIIGPRFSALYGIPLIFYGENPVEYGDSSTGEQATMESKYFTGRVDVKDLVLGGVKATDLMEKHKVDPRDFNPYLPMDGDVLKKLGTEVHYISYYLKWDLQENYYYAAENTGYVANTSRTSGSYSKYCSIDDTLDFLHFYTTLVKFGIGRATHEAAQEVRTGKITREEAVVLVRQYDTEFPEKHFKLILDYLDITEGQFWDVINRARSPHLWKKEGTEWKLRYQVT